MVEVIRSKGGPGGSIMSVSMTLTLDLDRAVAGMNSPQGVIGQAVRRAAETVKERAITLQASPEYTTATAQREGRSGRWKTGSSTTNITISHVGSNQYQSVARLTPGTSYWGRYQEHGTRYIAAAPVMGRALLSLRPADFI